MNLFRVIFLIASVLAIGGTSYVGYYGYGMQSHDLDRSVRTGSGGTFINTRVK
jgi:hypothetical protein